MSEYINYRLDGALMGRHEKRRYIANIGTPVGHWDPLKQEFMPASDSIDTSTYDELAKVPEGSVLVAVVQNGAFEAALPLLEERDMLTVWSGITRKSERRPVHLYLLTSQDVKKMMGSMPVDKGTSF